MSIPTSMKAFVSNGLANSTVQTVAVPTLAAGDILVKVRAVALNPTDWKHRDFLVPVGAGLGCDFSGDVVSITAGVTLVKVGDRVAGFVHGGQKPLEGSFAEYLKTEASLVWKVPSTTDYEAAAAMGGVGPHTAYQVLYMKHHIAPLTKPLTTSEPFLVWAGSSSVGLYAIQMARLAGYTVVTTCSPKNFDLVKSLGATAAYDYSDPSTPAKIKAAYPTLAMALDGIAEQETTALAAASLGEKGGKVVTLLPVAPELQGGRAEVEVQSTLAYTTLGKAFTFPGWASFEAEPKDKASIEEWLQYIPKIVASGEFKPNPLWKQPGGLDGVNAALELLKAGKTSGNKITLLF